MDLKPALLHRAQVEEFRRRHRTGLLTRVFTDIDGSTSLKQQLGDCAVAIAFEQHHRLLREILGRFGQGQEIETAGDSFLLAFGMPSDAAHFGFWCRRTKLFLSKEVHQIIPAFEA